MNQHNDEARGETPEPVISAPVDPVEPEPVCRADGQFVAGFMSPQTDDDRTLAMNWQGIDLPAANQAIMTIQVGDVEYGPVQAGDDGVVVTESVNGADVFHSLTRVSVKRGNNAFIGLPVPQMRTSSETWLPDNSYADVVDDFAQQFVEAYHQRGADASIWLWKYP